MKLGDAAFSLSVLVILWHKSGASWWTFSGLILLCGILNFLQSQARVRREREQVRKILTRAKGDDE